MRRGFGCAVVSFLVAVGALTHVSPATAAFGRACRCDCNADGAVTVEEILTSVNLALLGGSAGCGEADPDGSGYIDVAEVISCIPPALSGCPLVTVADAAFWETLGLVADRSSEAISLYEEAVREDPNDARSWFLKGMMHFYLYGRELDDYVSFSDEAKQEIELANAALDRAVELDPSKRSYPGFRGGTTFQNGVAHNRPSLVVLGIEQLRQSIELWPFFNRFSFFGTVAAVVPRDSPVFAESVQYLRDAVSPEGLTECTDNLCGNAGKAPANLPGTALLFGDLFAKAGDRQSATGWYSLGVGASGPSYPFRELLIERRNQVAERIGFYQDEDPSNDPLVVGVGSQNCVICHVRVQ